MTDVSEAEASIYRRDFDALAVDGFLPRVHLSLFLAALLSREPSAHELRTFSSLMPARDGPLSFDDVMLFGMAVSCNPKIPLQPSLRQLLAPAAAQLWLASMQAAEHHRLQSIAADVRKREQAQADRDLGRLTALTQQQQQLEGTATNRSGRLAYKLGLKKDMTMLCAVVARSHAAAKRARSARKRFQALTAVEQLLHSLADCSDNQWTQAMNDAVKEEAEAAMQVEEMQLGMQHIRIAKKRLAQAKGVIAAVKASHNSDDQSSSESELAAARQAMAEAVSTVADRKKKTRRLACAQAKKWVIHELVTKPPSAAEVQVLCRIIKREANQLLILEHENSAAEQTFKAGRLQLFHTAAAITYLARLKQRQSTKPTDKLAEAQEWLERKEALRVAVVEVVLLEGPAAVYERAMLAVGAAAATRSWLSRLQPMLMSCPTTSAIVQLLETEREQVRAAARGEQREEELSKLTAQLALATRLRAAVGSGAGLEAFRVVLLDCCISTAMLEGTCAAEAEICKKMFSMYQPARQALDGELLKVQLMCSHNPARLKRLALKIKGQLYAAQESLVSADQAEQKALVNCRHIVSAAIDELNCASAKQQLLDGAARYEEAAVSALVAEAEAVVAENTNDETIAYQLEKRSRVLAHIVDHIRNTMPDARKLLQAFSSKSAQADADIVEVAEMRLEWSAARDRLNGARARLLIVTGCIGADIAALHRWHWELRSMLASLDAQHALSVSVSLKLNEAGESLDRITAALIVGCKLKAGGKCAHQTEPLIHLRYKMKKHMLRSLANGSAALGSSIARLQLVGAVGAMSSIRLLKQRSTVQDLWTRSLNAAGEAVVHAELDAAIAEQTGKVDAWSSSRDYVAADKAKTEKVHLEGLLIKYQAAMQCAQESFSGDQLQALLAKYMTEETTLASQYEQKIGEHHTQRRGLRVWQAGHSCLRALQSLQSCLSAVCPEAYDSTAVAEILSNSQM